MKKEKSKKVPRPNTGEGTWITAPQIVALHTLQHHAAAIDHHHIFK